LLYAALISSTGTAFALQFAHSFNKQTANDAKAVDTRTVVTIAGGSCVTLNASTLH
jgi:ferric-dicitrate binding protein FerR (iron transport regulator)